MKNLQHYDFSKRFDDVPLVGSAFSGEHPGMIPLAFGFPYPKSFPIDALVESATGALKSEGTQALQYSGGPGQQRILEWIRQRSQLRAIQVNTDQIMITSGSNQGIDLVARTLTDPGDSVWVEAPVYFGALRAFYLAENQLSAFPVDGDGLRVDLVESALIEAAAGKRPMPKFIYVLPNYHNPAGIRLSVERRRKLAQLAYAYNVYIVEDDAYVELNFTGEFWPSIYSFGPERVIYLSTFSKIVAPGIRMAWVICQNPDVLSKMKIIKTEGLTSVLMQEIVSDYLEKNDFENHLEPLITGYRMRRDVMVEAIHEFFGDEVSFEKPEGGFFLWLTFPTKTDTTRLLHESVKVGVSFVDGKAFYLHGKPTNDLRLAFSFCDEITIREGIQKLAAVYKKQKYFIR
ncbi:PLP-dependent aminotransferase family protein [Sporolactobacillus sp. CPB3-1]|uniref:PLP-dependent aminotransferase family protein n=1 Tax=Sporolactobacillus mangiferae TaxID=2940498 RepID=A0ABT0MBW9_9BACL|nr:PLP-dependent aminotransferase family protein [Sporolactobacillus mangiferae]MCL1632153.1 PLP-dependent aminotransferase family protein [Sporolactobacillus mangiferae]